jgi:titin
MLFSSVTGWMKQSRHSTRSRASRPRRRVRPQLEALEDRLAPAIFTVINTQEIGPGSLYAAIQQSNGTPGAINEIDFNIPGAGAVHTIHMVNNMLLSITQAVKINGFTQPGAAPATQNSPAKPLIVLDGSAFVGQSYGLDIQSPNCVIQGLVINGFFSAGIVVEAGGTATITGNYIGTDATGTYALGNGGTGIILGSGGNTIGGLTPAQRNVISGNGYDGIYINGASATGNLIQGNYVGTDALGTSSLGNTNFGIEVQNAANTVIGGAVSGAGNVISGNHKDGIHIAGASATAATIQGNYIGTDKGGFMELGNTGNGIFITQAANALIGGASQGQGNVISGNHQEGIWFNQTTAATIQGNRIGTDYTGTVNLGNTGDGIALQDTSNSLIGGTSPGQGNVISANHGAGVSINGAAATGNQVQGNLIGTDKTAYHSVGNEYGVEISAGGSNNQIGGTAAGARNVISGNAYDGVYLTGAGGSNTVQGNLIGTDITGEHALGNGSDGVDIRSKGNLIGGTAPGAGNVISGQTARYGVEIGNDPNAVMNTIQGNKIGTDLSGTLALGNFGGLSIQGSNNQIGGTDPGAGNLISGNSGDGVRIYSTGIVVEGNLIGTDASGTKALGNGYVGIEVESGATNEQIGGTTAGAGNVIANSASSGGVDLVGSATVLGNSIFDNFNGITPVVANQPQGARNFPVLLAATATGAGTTITGTLNSTPNHTFRIEFFSNTSTDKASVAEGQTFLGWVNAMTDGNGNANFSYATGVLATGSLVTATATDTAGNTTSDFSAAVPTGLPPSITSVGKATFFQGRSNSFTFTATGKGTPALTESGALPAGVSFQDNGNGTATLTGKPTVTGSFTFTITAVNGIGSNATQTFRLVVLPPEAAFVLALYQDELGRTGDLSNPHDAGFWVTALTNKSVTQSQVASAIEHSPEARGHLVSGWYQTYLGRPAQTGELQFWVNQLLQGQSEEQVQSGILGSAEFFNHAQTLITSGTPEARYVQALYKLLLNRTGSAAELAGWNNVLQAQGRQGVALGFLQSAEDRKDVIQGYYGTLLHRTPSAVELNNWVMSSLDFASIRLGFESSLEFFTNG